MTASTTRTLQGRYRPAVRRAWETVCEKCHTDPADRTAYDLWYRQRLREMAGITTTAGITAAQMESLIEGFLLLAGEEPVGGRRRQAVDSGAFPLPPVPAFSPAQQTAFNRLVAKAWRKVQDVDPSVDVQAWFNARMNDAHFRDGLGFGGNLFDRAMGRFGIIAGDDFWIRRTAEARERRLRHVIRAKLAELGSLTQRELDWSYVQGIHDQAKLSHSLDDCPADYLLSIVHMLGSAIAREKRRK